MKKQVEAKHYEFSKYMTKKRWSSIWHQLDEVIKLQPSNVLEVGPGPGVLKAIASNFGLDFQTLDIDKELNPDVVASAANIPFIDKSFDVVCSFQMLEHMPFKISLEAIKEISRVSKKYVIISLPDAEARWPYNIYIPKLGAKYISVKKPFSKVKEHVFDGEHYWEINKKGYELCFVTKEIDKVLMGYKLLRSYRVPDNPYHRFFIYERSADK